MTESAKPAAPAAGPQVLLQKVYLKNASVEIPQAPAVFTKQWQPQMDVQVNTKVTAIADDHWEIVLAVTVTAKLEADTAFLVEVQQAGIFQVKGFADGAERQAVLGAYCPGVVFPFARETVADLIQRAGFPSLLLQPINFDALYAEHQKRAQAAATTNAVTSKPH